MTTSDLDAFFGRYSERYMAADVDAVSAMYRTPMFAVREGRVIHLGDDAKLREHLGALMSAYVASGAARADIASLEIVRLGESAVFATINWNVRDSAGDVLKDFRTTYHLVRAEADWRILSYTNHD